MFCDCGGYGDLKGLEVPATRAAGLGRAGRLSGVPPYRGSDHVGPDDGGKEGVLGGTRRVLAVPGHAHGGRAAVREAEAVLRVPVSAAVG